MIYQRQASFQEAVRSALVDNYCNFSGRASRSQFWWYTLFSVLVSWAASVLTLLGTFGEVISYVVAIVLFLPGLGVAVRRLHDINKSGWWILLGLIPLVGQIILIVWYCKNSDMVPNQYGDIPLLVENDFPQNPYLKQ